MTVHITEASKAAAPTGARTLITLITPGWGSSGYYSAKMLEQAAKDKVFPAGTQMHLDHDAEAGVGSVNNLAARLQEDARWDPNYVDPDTGVKGGLVAENLVFAHKRDMLKELKDTIGTSIAAAAEITMGEAEGRTGPIIERLLPSRTNRVDYVTVAGRGGRITEVLESGDGIVTRAVENGVAEATAGEVRDWLRQAVRQANGGSYAANGGSYAYLLDYDEGSAYYEVDGVIYQDTYTVEGVVATLGGTPVEVRPVTTYVPVPVSTTEAHKDSAPNPAAATENQGDATMATIDDKELADLRESAGRATSAEATVTEATQRATAAEAALVQANDTAAAVVVESALQAAGLTAPKLAARLAQGYPVQENGVLDSAKLSETVAEAVAELQVAGGAGTVSGVGHTQENGGGKPALTHEDATKAILANAGYTPKGAK